MAQIQAEFTGQVAWAGCSCLNTFDHSDERMLTMGTGRHLVSYPLRGGGTGSIWVAVEEGQLGCRRMELLYVRQPLKQARSQLWTGVLRHDQRG